jgi:hypothetical protein
MHDENFDENKNKTEKIFVETPPTKLCPERRP